MHEIQRHILKVLTFKNPARFADLKPPRVESNRFMYHLRELLEREFIVKKESRYRLTPSGKRFIDRVSLENLEVRIQPKIVTLLAITNKKGEYLLYRRKRQPFFNYVGFPYGKIHLGERIAEAAKRELTEKTGLNVSLTHRGDVYITVHDEENLITQMLCHIFSGKNPTGQLLEDSSIGHCFFQKSEAIDPKEQIPGFKQIVKLLHASRKPFFAEYFLDIHEN